MVDDERYAYERAFRLLEAVQGERPDAALDDVRRARTRAQAQGWTRVELVLRLDECVHALVHGPDAATADDVEALLTASRSAGATALQAAALGVRAMLAGSRADTAGLLADAAEAVRLLDDPGLPAAERSTAYVITAAAYNSMRLWELVDDINLWAEQCDRDDPCVAQRPAIAANRVIIRVEWALALMEVGRDEEARRLLRRAAVAVEASEHVSMPPLWRRAARAGGELVAVLEDPSPRRRRDSVEALIAELREAGEIEVLPLLEAAWPLALLRSGHHRAARRAVRRLRLGTSVSSGGSTVPSWVRALVLQGRRPSAAVRAQAQHAERLAQARWEGRLAVLDAATAQIEVARRRAERERLLLEATTDALTGLGNRRVFDTWLAGAIEGIGDPAVGGLLLVDLDDFKVVNDRFGHGVGDEVLRAVGRFVTDVLRPGDVGLRLGGDEFAIIVADTGDDPDLTSRARELRARIACWDWDQVMPGRVQRISIGAGVSDDPAASRTDLYRWADDALYAAKRHRSPTSPTTPR